MIPFVLHQTSSFISDFICSVAQKSQKMNHVICLNLLASTNSMEFFLNGAEPSMNSVNSANSQNLKGDKPW